MKLAALFFIPLAVSAAEGDAFFDSFSRRFRGEAAGKGLSVNDE